MNRGLLLTMTEPPAAMEEEFNAWYDDEHLAERLAIPGFRTAKRWVVADVAPGQGKYLGTYELDSPLVLESEEYLKKYRNQTPWSKRCLSKCIAFRRWACEQVEPGNAPDDPAAKILLLGWGDTKPSIKAPARLFFDPAGKPRYTLLLEGGGMLEIPGWEFRTYKAYTRKP
jgi:hypothetical protein